MHIGHFSGRKLHTTIKKKKNGNKAFAVDAVQRGFMFNLCDVYSTDLRIHVEVWVFGLTKPLHQKQSYSISSNIMFKQPV